MPPADLPAAPAGGPILVPFGDDAILADLREPAGIRAARRAGALARAIEALRAGDRRLGVPVPGAASVLVPFDADAAEARDVADLLEPLLAALPEDPPPPPDAREHLFPTRYGGEDGPDLAATAALAGLSDAAVVDLHAATVLEVLFLGSRPGSPTWASSRLRWRSPAWRRRAPWCRPEAWRSPTGSARSTRSPRRVGGGCIGRTDVTLFDPAADPPVRLRPGDRVRFVPL